GRTGFVHKAVMTDFTDLSGYQVYTCGGPGMIDIARREFVAERGLPPEGFFAAAFSYSAQVGRPEEIEPAARLKRHWIADFAGTTNSGLDVTAHCGNGRLLLQAPVIPAKAGIHF